MSDDTIDDSIQVTRREVLKGAAVLAASTAAAATAVTALSTSAAAATSPDSGEGQNSTKRNTGGVVDAEKQMNGARAFFRSLENNDVDVVFSTPGTSEMQVVDEVGYSNFKVVSCIFENTVTGAADGYFRIKNKPALAILHVTTGLMNSLCNLHNARKARSSMIIYDGGVHAHHEVNEPEHQVSLRTPDVARAACDWVYEAKNPHDLASSAVKSVQAANRENGKIALVYGPNNAIWGDTSVQMEKALPANKTRVSKYTIEDVAASLKAGKKSAFVLGGTATTAEGLDIARRIADATGSELFREWINMKYIDGGAGRASIRRIEADTSLAQEEFSKYDQVILVATDKVPAGPFSYEDLPFKAVPDDMHIKTLAPVDSDVIAALKDLAKEVGVSSTSKNINKRVIPDAPTGSLNGQAVVDSIIMAMPKDAIIIDESYYEGYMLHDQLPGAEPHTLMTGACGGAIGGGVPVGIGCGIADPNRKIVVITGDWSMMQGCQSLWTVAQQKIDMCIICLNNSGSASLESELARVRKGDAQPKSLEMLDLTNPTINYGDMAKSMGVNASFASNAEDFFEQFTQAMNTKGPHFINAKVDSYRAILVAAHMKRRNLPDAKDGRGHKGWEVLQPE